MLVTWELTKAAGKACNIRYFYLFNVFGSKKTICVESKENNLEPKEFHKRQFV